MLKFSQVVIENSSTFPLNDTNFHQHHPAFSEENIADESRDSLYLVLPITLIYGVIFIVGCIGNISTCIVIAKNKSMYSATNYYLFSLAISDFMLLISGVPMELYHIWFKNEFMFGNTFCILRNMVNEMSANATVLTSKSISFKSIFNFVDLIF